MVCIIILTDDYGLVAEFVPLLYFGPSPANNSASFSIRIVDDILVEENEDFFINLDTFYTLGYVANVLISPDETRVIISDNDGEPSV